MRWGIDRCEFALTLAEGIDPSKYALRRAESSVIVL